MNCRISLIRPGRSQRSSAKPSKKISPEVLGNISQIDDYSKLADTIASHLAIKIADLVKEGRIKAEDRVSHATAEIAWLAEHWFPRDNYVRIEDRPVLLSFGHEGLTDDEWSSFLQVYYVGMTLEQKIRQIRLFGEGVIPHFRKRRV